MLTRFVSTFLIIVSVLPATAQQSKQLKFSEETFDFGKVAEEKGPVVHEFTVTNNSSRPVKIINVQPSCGCTTPGWTKEPIQPGKTGSIQASFDPKGRPGFFTKSLTVTTDLDANPVVLQIKGQVTNESLPAESDLAVANGSLKFKSAAFNLGKVFLKDEFTTREFPVVNGSAKPVNFTGNFVSPKYIKVDVQPRTLAPGEKGTIKVSYNGKLKNQYGFQSDNVEIHTDDETNPVKSFSVYATLEEYFGNLSAAELEAAPALNIVDQALDFGKINGTSIATREISITNNGRKELSLRSLQGNCTCVKALATKNPLKPGESTTIKISFDPQGRTGTQQKAVTIYSNDPKNPVQRVTFTAYID